MAWLFICLFCLLIIAYCVYVVVSVKRGSLRLWAFRKLARRKPAVAYDHVDTGFRGMAREVEDYVGRLAVREPDKLQSICNGIESKAQNIRKFNDSCRNACERYSFVKRDIVRHKYPFIPYVVWNTIERWMCGRIGLFEMSVPRFLVGSYEVPYEMCCEALAQAERARSLIWTCSPRYVALLKFSESNKILHARDWFESENCNSLQQFRDFSIGKYVRKLMSRCPSECRAFLQTADQIMAYNDKLSFVVSEYPFLKKSDMVGQLSDVRYNVWHTAEADACDRLRVCMLPVPGIRVHWSYDSPAGRNHYSQNAYAGYQVYSRIFGGMDKRSFSVCDEKPVCGSENHCDNDVSGRFSIRNPGSVGNKLRYSVLRRDGFKCTRCGRSSRNGAELHMKYIGRLPLDHIVTEKDLVTICSVCRNWF